MCCWLCCIITLPAGRISIKSDRPCLHQCLGPTEKSFCSIQEEARPLGSPRWGAHLCVHSHPPVPSPQQMSRRSSPPPKPALHSAPHAAPLLKACPSTTITTTAGKLCDLSESSALSQPDMP